MPKPLTVKTIESVRPGPTRREIPDGALTGLYLIVQPSGAMSWAIRFRADGKPKKHTIGNYPAFGLAEARKAAAAALRTVAEGRDPNTEKKEARAARMAEADLFENVVAEFIVRHVRQKPRSAPENERLLARNVLPVWKGRKVQSIKRRDVIALLDGIIDRGSPVAANRVLAIVRRFFNWTVERGIIEVSPVTGVKAPTVEVSRDRVLTDRELRLVWKAAEGLGYPFGPVVHLLILTAQRRSEVAEMTWKELHLDGDAPEWIIPRDRAKNGQEHLVPLSVQAVEVFAGVPRLRSDRYFVFTTTGRTPVSGHSNAKEALDKAIARLVEEEGGEPVPAWTIHDLRRTAASGMARLRIAPHVVEAVLNHRSGTVSGVAAIYNRHSYREEKEGALSAWGRYVADLVSEQPAGNVVEMRGRV